MAGRHFFQDDLRCNAFFLSKLAAGRKWATVDALGYIRRLT
jgi:hypothetical protein